jgi:hypothetical protein
MFMKQKTYENFKTHKITPASIILFVNYIPHTQDTCDIINVLYIWDRNSILKFHTHTHTHIYIYIMVVNNNLRPSGNSDVQTAVTVKRWIFSQSIVFSYLSQNKQLLFHKPIGIYIDHGQCFLYGMSWIIVCSLHEC